MYDDKTPLTSTYGYRGRFAPSPTGPLHAGSLVAALGSWLDAQKNGGKWLLRIEDLDTPRCVAGADQEIMRQLLACGLQWDEAVSWQSTGQTRYQSALEALNQLQTLYPCTCSRQTIANALAKLGTEIARNQEMIYPGTCRPTNLQIHNHLGNAVAWRVALPTNLQIEFMDRRLGNQQQNLNQEVGDFVLRRSDQLFTYQLAVVVDDAQQGITHIVRGEDLLNNTARQIHLQHLLHYKTPQYLHLPLVRDESGEKLSKQTMATAINTQDAKSTLAELEKAGGYLGLGGIALGRNASIADWLLAATKAWQYA